MPVDFTIQSYHINYPYTKLKIKFINYQYPVIFVYGYKNKMICGIISTICQQSGYASSCIIKDLGDDELNAYIEEGFLILDFGSHSTQISILSEKQYIGQFY